MSFIELLILTIIIGVGGTAIVVWLYEFLLNSIIGNYLVFLVIPLLFYFLFKVITLEKES